MCALECFLTRMRENVLLEIASCFARIITLSAFERILPLVDEEVFFEAASLRERILAL